VYSEHTRAADTLRPSDRFLPACAPVCAHRPLVTARTTGTAFIAIVSLGVLLGGTYNLIDLGTLRYCTNLLNNNFA
jgi:hypothetical protein